MEGRPVLENEDGSVSTEETVTVEIDGKFYNIPTIVGGKRVGEEAAILLWKGGDNPEVGVFGSLGEAVKAAKERSDRLGGLISRSVRVE